MSVRFFVNGYWVQLPLNNIDLNGSINFDLASVTASATLGSSDCMIIADATAGEVTINLPSVASAGVGRTYYIKKVDSSNNSVVVDGDGTETIDGSLTQTIDAEESLTITCNNSEWWVI